MLEILYFASFREVLGKAQEELPVENYKTVDCVLKDLAGRGEAWQQALKDNANLQIAVNHSVATRQTELNSGDEIAFFPPVTGG